MEEDTLLVKCTNSVKNVLMPVLSWVIKIFQQGAS